MHLRTFGNSCCARLEMWGKREQDLMGYGVRGQCHLWRVCVWGGAGADTRVTCLGHGFTCVCVFVRVCVCVCVRVRAILYMCNRLEPDLCVYTHVGVLGKENMPKFCHTYLVIVAFITRWYSLQSSSH